MQDAVKEKEKEFIRPQILICPQCGETVVNKRRFRKLRCPVCKKIFSESKLRKW